MEDNMKDFSAKLKEVFKKAGVKYGHLDKVFDDAAKSKERINSILGLNVENDYRKVILMEMSDTEFDQMYPHARQIFDRIPGWNGGWNPTAGKLTVGKDKVNITKFLAKQLAEKTIAEEYIQYLYRLLKIDPANPKAESQIVPKFGELINKKTDNAVIISTNPFDMFTSSAGDFGYAAFKSCFRPGGEYFNGCNSFARDNFTTIAYKASLKKPDYKHGRAWMFILDDIIAQTKSYGTFTGNERKLARTFAEQNLAAHLGVDPADFKGHRVQKWKDSATKNRHVLYFDDYEIDLGYLTSRYGTFTDAKVPMLEFAKARCLSCGRETVYPQQGICGVCSGNFSACKVCDTEIMGDIKSVNVGSERYCTSCATTHLEVCSDCGNHHVKGTGIQINGKGNVCPVCIKKNYYTCDSCHEIHSKKVNNFAVVIGDAHEIWCKPCYDVKAFKCGDCGVHHVVGEKTEVTDITGKVISVCTTCAKEYHICPDCNEPFKGGHETETGVVCGACVANYDYCTSCDILKHKTKMVFDGTTISCETCVKGKKEATTEAYNAEIDTIIAAVTAATDATKDTELEIVQLIIQDRKENGYADNDIVRIKSDNSWHGFPVGSLLSVYRTEFTLDGMAIYKAFKDGCDWYFQDRDLELARPAICAGDEIAISGKPVEVVEVITETDKETVYVIGNGSKVKASADIKYVDLIDLGIPAPIVYAVGEVLVIRGNVSRHGFKATEKVKVYRKDTFKGFTRYFVKVGKRTGVIYGSELDTTRQAAVKKPVLKEKRMSF